MTRRNAADALAIGAGMAGLTAAREPVRHGFAVAVVEARQRNGRELSATAA